MVDTVDKPERMRGLVCAGSAESADDLRSKILEFCGESIALEIGDEVRSDASNEQVWNERSGGSGPEGMKTLKCASLLQYFDVEVESFVDLLDSDQSWQV